MEGTVAAFIPEPEVTRTGQVAQHALGLNVEDLGGFAHGTAKHADGEGDVGASVGGAVQQGTNKTLIALEQDRVNVRSVSRGRTRSLAYYAAHVHRV